MTTLLRKYSTLILISLLLAVLLLAWLFPSAGFFLGIIFLIFSFFITGAAVIAKHREKYRQGKITRRVFLRTVALEITGIWLAMILAGLLGRTLAEVATQYITHELTRLFAGIAIGMLVGVGIGLLVRQIWVQSVKTSPGS
jgi:hypothetical protein